MLRKLAPNLIVLVVMLACLAFLLLDCHATLR
jgi:hypothetical protein